MAVTTNQATAVCQSRYQPVITLPLRRGGKQAHSMRLISMAQRSTTFHRFRLHQTKIIFACTSTKTVPALARRLDVALGQLHRFLPVAWLICRAGCLSAHRLFVYLQLQQSAPEFHIKEGQIALPHPGKGCRPCRSHRFRRDGRPRAAPFCARAISRSGSPSFGRPVFCDPARNSRNVATRRAHGLAHFRG